MRARVGRGVLAGVWTAAILGLLLVLANGPQPAPAAADDPATAQGAARGANPATPTASTVAATPTPSGTAQRLEGKTLVAFSGTPDPPSAALHTFYGQRVTWARCADHRQFACATVRVPVDYTKPSGRTVGISLRRLPAGDAAHRKGTLFVNPGGPGASGTQMASALPDVFDKRLLKVWDVVGFDPRGIGQSGSFTCLTDAELDAIYAADPTPDTAAEQKQYGSILRDANRTCLRRGGELARHMGSDDVARDLDVLRDAVGDERLNYYGVSYGTLIGARYAEHFPSRVGLMVLDSAVRPDPVDDHDVTQKALDGYAFADATGFDGTVDRFAKNCRASVKCPLGPDSKAVAATIVRLLDRIERAPLHTDVDSLPRLTEGWAVTAISLGLGDESSWPDLIDALDAAVTDRDGTGLARLASDAVRRDEDGTYPDGPVGNVFMPVMCADWRTTRWDTMTPSPDVARDHPLWGRVANQQLTPCAGWEGPVRPDQAYEVDLPTPVLVIGNKDDTTTPIEDTEALADLIGGSKLVTVDAPGHGAYAAGNECADDAVDDYLVDSKAPEDDRTCPA